MAVNDGAPSPSVTYGAGRCCANQEFAEAELAFRTLAQEYGFSRAALPEPTAAPCTAVRANELIVGSHGELYKCYESIGNPTEVSGNIRNYTEPTGRMAKWLKYDPFDDAECQSCIALPVCMGGCAHHALDSALYSNRCDTFRHTYREQILRYVDAGEARAPSAARREGNLEKAR